MDFTILAVSDEFQVNDMERLNIQLVIKLQSIVKVIDFKERKNFRVNLKEKTIDIWTMDVC